MPIKITDKAATEILRVIEEQQLPIEDTVLRLGIDKGFSGISYSMTFGRKQEMNLLEDTLYVFNGLNVIVTRHDDQYLNKATIDFYESLERRGFTFDNPGVAMTSGGCSTGGRSGGCGSSCGGCG